MEIVRETPQRTLHTVAEFAQRHLFLTEGGLRFQIFNANENELGDSGAIVRLGRRVLINEEKYFDWIDFKQNQNVGQKV